MKQTTTKLKLFLYICLGMIVLNGCTFEEEVIKQNGYQEKLKFESKKFSELMQLPAFSKAYERVINKKVTLSNDFAARTALEDQYGFTIVEDKDVKVITDVDGSVYYNMLIERVVKENLKFENLVIKVKNGDVGAVILKYELNEKATYVENHDTYAVDIKKSSIQVLEVEGKALFIPINCWNVVTLTCNDLSDNESPNHVPHSGCLAAAINNNYAYITTTITQYCFGIDLDLGGPSGPSPIGTSGDGGGNATVTNPNTNPTPNTNQNGETPLTDNTPPIKNVIIPSDEVVEEGIDSDQCEKLKNLISIPPNPPNINPFRNALIYNQNAVTNKNYEVGHTLRLNGNNQISINEVDNLASDCNNLKLGLLTSPYLFGFFHSHPANCGNYGLGEMFSFPDIASFCKIVKNHNFGNGTYPNGTTVNPDNFILTVASSFGTFAIKINDFETFRNKAIEILSSQESYNDFEEEYNKGVPNMFEDEEKKTVGLLKTLNSLFNNSLSVYKAKPDFTGWDKLELTNNNTKSKKTPCSN